MLMSRAITFCKEKKFKKVYVTTFSALNAEERLYQEWDFKLTSEVENSAWGVAVKEQKFELIL